MENAPADSTLTISSPAQLSCGVLAFPVWSGKTQKASFQSPKKPRTGAAPGHSRPWVSFQRISGWMRDCGLWAVRGEGISLFQISGLAHMFRLCSSHTRYFSPLGIKVLLARNGRHICCSAASAPAPSLLSTASLCHHPLPPCPTPD